MYRVFDWIVTNYILTNCLKIQQNFLKYYKLYWINSEGYNLNFTVFYSIQMTVRHLFLFCGIFESIPNCINYRINDSFFSKIRTVLQYQNSERGTFSNTGSTAQNRLFWSTAHVQDCLQQAIYLKLSPRLISTQAVSNTIPVLIINDDDHLTACEQCPRM